MPHQKYPDPPASEKALELIKKKILEPGLSNQSVTLITFWGSGKTSQIKYLLSYPEITFRAEDSRIFSIIDLEKLSSEPKTAISYTISWIKTHYIKHPNQLVSKTVTELFSPESSNPEVFLDRINNLTFTKSLGITFMIEKAHLLLLKENGSLRSFLAALHQTNPMKISFIFNVPCEISENQKTNLGDLATTFLQNVVYSNDIPWDTETARRFIANEEKYTQHTLCEEFKIKSIELTISDPQTHKIVVDKALNNNEFEKYAIGEYIISAIYNNIGSDLLYTRFSSIIENINKDSWNFLTEKTKIPTEYLIRTGLIVNVKEQTYRPMNPLFEEFLRKEKNNKSAGINKLALQIKGQLTYQEGNLIGSLLENENRIVNRENAAKILWEEKWEETYTDWALDKAISRLRKKLETAGFEKKLKTIKGRGFALQ
jgi:hypothetical protein